MRRLHTYYKWQRRPYTIVEARQKVQFAEVTAYPLACLDGIIACGYMDLRKGINGLTILVQSRFRLDPFTNTLFLLCGRWKDRIKALYWEGNCIVLLYKRLENGNIQWPLDHAYSCHRPS